jgi:uncharacterized protein
MSAPADAAPPVRLDHDPALAPVAAPDRIPLLDVLRGFALYGVLLANTVWFSGRAFLPREPGPPPSLDVHGVAEIVIRIFVDAKAMTLFSFLFGLGFAVQLERAEARGRSGLPTYLRRLGIMLALGFCHIVLIWWGDILWNYALTGFVMILFRKRSQRALLIWALLLAFLPSLVGAIPAVDDFFARTLPHPPDQTAFRAQMLEALRGHDRAHLTWMHLQMAFYHGTHMPLSLVCWPLSRFLLGYAVGRSRILQNVAARRPLFHKLLGWGIALGVVCAVVFLVRRGYVRAGNTLSTGLKIAMVVPDELGVLATATAYLSALALLMERPAWRKRLMRLAPVGQMALSNYLSQSLICTFLFYGWGLGLSGRVGTALTIPLTLAIFAAQMIWSPLWLKRFRFGPAEWVWRSLTYGAMQPMQRREPPGAGLADQQP